MWRPSVKNRVFDRMSDRWAPWINPSFFLSKRGFDLPGRSAQPPQEERTLDHPPSGGEHLQAKNTMGIGEEEDHNTPA